MPNCKKESQELSARTRDKSIAYYQKNREKRVAYTQHYRLIHKAEIAQKRKEDYHANPELHHALGKQYREKYKDKLKADRDRTKLEVYSHYCKGSTKCACCGESEFVFLTIDHIIGRKSMGHGKGFSGHKLRLWLKKNAYPEGFQVSCLNCNAAKSDKGMCPHQKIAGKISWGDLFANRL